MPNLKLKQEMEQLCKALREEGEELHMAEIEDLLKRFPDMDHQSKKYVLDMIKKHCGNSALWIALENKT